MLLKPARNLSHLDFRADVIVAFRSAKGRLFRGAKGDNERQPEFSAATEHYAAAGCDWAWRGRRTENVLPRPGPGLVAEIVPPCWWMMRWLIESPRPVP